MFRTLHNDAAAAIRGGHVWTIFVDGVAVWSQIVFWAPVETDELLADFGRPDFHTPRN